MHEFPTFGEVENVHLLRGDFIPLSHDFHTLVPRLSSAKRWGIPSKTRLFHSTGEESKERLVTAWGCDGGTFHRLNGGNARYP